MAPSVVSERQLPAGGTILIDRKEDSGEVDIAIVPAVEEKEPVGAAPAAAGGEE